MVLRFAKALKDENLLVAAAVHPEIRIQWLLGEGNRYKLVQLVKDH